MTRIVMGVTTIDALSRAEEIQSEIERLIPRAETGEQWAHICLLEKQMLELAPVRIVGALWRFDPSDFH